MATKPITDLDNEAAIVRKVGEVRKDRSTATKRGNAWTAVATLHTLEATLLKRLGELREAATKTKDETGGVGTMSEAELAEVLALAMPDLPEDAFELLAAAVDLRRTGRPSLRIVDESR